MVKQAKDKAKVAFTIIEEEGAVNVVVCMPRGQKYPFKQISYNKYPEILTLFSSAAPPGINVYGLSSPAARQAFIARVAKDIKTILAGGEITPPPAPRAASKPISSPVARLEQKYLEQFGMTNPGSKRPCPICNKCGWDWGEHYAAACTHEPKEGYPKKPAIPAPKFKVGDVVQVIASTAGDFGTTFTVSSVVWAAKRSQWKDHKHYHYTGKKLGAFNWEDESWLRLVSPAPAPKFKVGERVWLRKDGRNHYGANPKINGGKVEIVKPSSNPLLFPWDYHVHVKGDTSWGQTVNESDITNRNPREE